MQADNLFKYIPEKLPEEILDTLVESKDFKLERIVSQGQTTSEDWLEQELQEWVILLSGRAKILFEGESALVELTPGDYLKIPAYTRHRVEWTDPQQKTVWLALHYRNKQI
ncbi:MAG: cupin domain-containing protein [Candidatus Omnitrophota bacterium]